MSTTGISLILMESFIKVGLPINRPDGVAVDQSFCDRAREKGITTLKVRADSTYRNSFDRAGRPGRPGLVFDNDGKRLPEVR